MPFATKGDAASFQIIMTRIHNHPEPNVHEVAKQFIQAKLGVNGDDIVLAHFKNDDARAAGKPDKTQTLTDAVMHGFMDFVNHGWVPATLGLAGGVFFGGDSSPTVTRLGNDLWHSDSFLDGAKKVGNFLWSRTGPGWIYNTFFADGNVVDKAKEEYKDIDTSYGLFKNNGKGYAKENSYELTPSQVYDRFRAVTRYSELPYIKLLNKKMDSYWSEVKNDWPTAARYNFVEQARAARDNGVLTSEQYRMVMKGGAPGVPLKGPVTFEQISKAAPPDPSVSVERFDINGYASTHILRFKDDHGGEVMYVPGPKAEFVPLRNKQESLQWVTSQAAKDSPKRGALLGHFSIWNRQDGHFHYGVEAGLDGLANGSWDPSYLNYYDNQDRNKIKTDVFEDMRTQTEGRLREDATMQTHNAWDGWRQTVDRSSLLLGPLGNLVQVGLGIDVAVNGKTYDERHDGLIQAIDGGAYLGVDAVTYGVARSRMGHYDVQKASKPGATGGDAGGSVASDAPYSPELIGYKGSWRGPGDHPGDETWPCIGCGRLLNPGRIDTNQPTPSWPDLPVLGLESMERDLLPTGEPAPRPAARLGTTASRR